MLKDTMELNLKVLKARLLTKAEYKRFSNLLPLPDYLLLEGWWLADADEIGNVFVARAGGVLSLTGSQNPDIYVRVALDIEGDIEKGDEFIHHGVVFTALSKNLAISNNFLGKARYHDAELIQDYIDFNDCFNADDEAAWEEKNDRINAIKSTLLEEIESLYGADEKVEFDDDILIDDLNSDDEDDYEIDGDVEDDDEDASNTVSCKKCHYYDICDEKDDELRYCPSFRAKK